MIGLIAGLLALLFVVPVFAQVPPVGPLGLPLGPAVPGIIQPPNLTSTTSSVTSSPDVTVSGTLTNLGDTVAISLSGRAGFGANLVGVASGTAPSYSVDVSFNNQVSWVLGIVFYQIASGSPAPTGLTIPPPAPVVIVTASGGASTITPISVTSIAGATDFRVRLNNTPGTAVTIQLTATAAAFTPPIVMPTGSVTATFGGSTNTFGLPSTSPLRLGGTPFTLRTTSAAFTPPAVSATLPPHPVMTFSGHAVAATNNYVIDAVSIRVLGAAATAYTVGARLVRRHVMYASTQTAAPAAGAVPTCANLAYNAAGNAGGTFTYKYVAVDIWGNEGNLSAASANCTPPANNGSTVTMPAVPAGAAGYNLYRTTTGPGATYYFVGRSNTTTFRDITADSSLTLAQGSINAWGTLPAIETLTQPVELVMEKFVALTGTAPVIVSTKTAPATKDNNRVVTIAPGTAIGRYRIPGEVEAKAFLAAPTITTALARDIDTDYGMGGTTQINAAFGDIAVNSFNQSDAGMGGTFVVWGHDLVGMTEQQSILSNNAGANQLAGIAEGTTLTMKWVAPPVFATADEVAVEVGAFGTAASVTLEVYVSGRVF